ncbi:MAG: DinB family protein [Planctomycetales bacterium]|nr:DinB family protein [Planctomycetales bacterium]
MNAQDAIRGTLETGSMVLNSYLGDLSDAELMRRPGKGCNHIAWQLGHLISAECDLLESICPGAAAKLPEGFAEKHSKGTCGEDDASKFCTKAEYLELFEKVHAATLVALQKMSEADLDAEGPEKFREMFPTVGSIFILIASHGMMHAGQLVPLRRELGKPVVI